MSKQELIEKTTKRIYQLNNERLIAVSDFVDFILRQQEEEVIARGIRQIAETSTTYDFLNEDPVVYTPEDCKERYH